MGCQYSRTPGRIIGGSDLGIWGREEKCSKREPVRPEAQQDPGPSAFGRVMFCQRLSLGFRGTVCSSQVLLDGGEFQTGDGNDSHNQ